MDTKTAPVQLDTKRLSPQTEEAGAALAVQDRPEAGPIFAETNANPVQDIEQQVVEVLRNCFDPEIPVNIYELGLIYNIDVTPEVTVAIRMTLTSPACPAAGSLPPEVQARVQAIPGVTAAKVEVVWDPPWNQGMMSEAAKLQLGIYDY